MSIEKARSETDLRGNRGKVVESRGGILYLKGDHCYIFHRLGTSQKRGWASFFGTKHSKRLAEEEDHLPDKEIVLYGKFAGTEIELGDDDILTMTEHDILGIMEHESSPSTSIGIRTLSGSDSHLVEVDKTIATILESINERMAQATELLKSRLDRTEHLFS